MIRLNQIAKSYGSKQVLHPIDLELNSGEHTVIMGANGAGKSTLLRLAAKGIEPSSGYVTYGENHQAINAAELSRMRAFLSQHYSRDLNFTAFDLVLLGRQPFYQYKPSKVDTEIVFQALERFQLLNYAHTPVNQLSGGELQRVHLARVYAQIIGNETTEKYFFMDEPSNNLDMKFQIALFELVDELLEKNTTVVSVLHDINMALGLSNRIIFLKHGIIQHDIEPQECSTEILEDVYEIPFEQIGDSNFRPRVCMRNDRRNPLKSNKILAL